jgi:hypothetical protein
VGRPAAKPLQIATDMLPIPQKSVRFFEAFCCRAFQEGHKNQVRVGIQLIIGVEKS